MRPLKLTTRVHVMEAIAPNLGDTRITPPKEGAEAITVEVLCEQGWVPLWVHLSPNYSGTSPEKVPMPRALAIYRIWAEYLSELVKRHRIVQVEYVEELEAYLLAESDPELEAKANKAIDSLLLN